MMYRFHGRRSPLTFAMALILSGGMAVADSFADLSRKAPTRAPAAAKADEAFSYNPRTGSHGHVQEAHHADPPRNAPWVVAGGAGLLIAGFGLVGAVMLLGTDEHADAPAPKKHVFDGIELGNDGLDDELRSLVQQQEKS